MDMKTSLYNIGYSFLFYKRDLPIEKKFSDRANNFSIVFFFIYKTCVRFSVLSFYAITKISKTCAFLILQQENLQDV